MVLVPSGHRQCSARTQWLSIAMRIYSYLLPPVILVQPDFHSFPADRIALIRVSISPGDTIPLRESNANYQDDDSSHRYPLPLVIRLISDT